MKSAMTSARGMRRVTACDLKQRRVRENPDVQRRMGRVISGVEPLSDTWGHVQSPTASRLSRLCRSVQDDLYGTFKTVIGAIFAMVTQKAVVCAV